MTERTRREVLRIAGAAVLGIGSLAGCLGDESERQVAMTDDFVFDPSTVTIQPGTTVRWYNDGTVPHTVTAYDGRLPAGAAYFASGGFGTERAARNEVRGGLVREGETFEHTFEVAGRYEYFCVPHEGSGMVGTVRVG